MTTPRLRLVVFLCGLLIAQWCAAEAAAQRYKQSRPRRPVAASQTQTQQQPASQKQTEKPAASPAPAQKESASPAQTSRQSTPPKKTTQKKTTPQSRSR